MSKQACTEFYAKVNTDRTLQQEVTTALEGKESDEAANAFVWVGAKHGYEFTAAEATQKYQELIAATKQEEGELEELEEEALDQVAGGGRGGDRRCAALDQQGHWIRWPAAGLRLTGLLRRSLIAITSEPPNLNLCTLP